MTGSGKREVGKVVLAFVLFFSYVAKAPAIDLNVLPADLNGDGQVGAADLLVFQEQWKSTVQSATAEIAGVRIFLCTSTAIADSTTCNIRGWVDYIDARGNIINDTVIPHRRRLNMTLNRVGSFSPVTLEQSVTSTLESVEGVPFEIFAGREGYSTLSVKDASTTAWSTKVEVAFLPSATLSGIIKDSTGNPLPGVRIDVTPRINEPDNLPYGFQVYSATTGSDGRYVVTGIYAPGGQNPRRHYQVSVVPEEYNRLTGSNIASDCTTHGSVEVFPGIHISGIDADLIDLPDRGSLEGSVSLNGEAFIDVISTYVALFPTFENCGSNYVRSASLELDSGWKQGHFKLDGLKDGAYYLSVGVFGTLPEREASYLLKGPTSTIIISVTDTTRIQADLLPQPVWSTEQYFPVRYAPVGDTFTFRWQLPAKIPDGEYNILVLDRCGREVWHSPAVPASAIPYQGPALSQEQIYTWYLTGTDAEQTFAAIGTVTGGYASFRYRK